VVAATAHPAKFGAIVEPPTGHAVEPPPAPAESLARPAGASRCPTTTTPYGANCAGCMGFREWRQ